MRYLKEPEIASYINEGKEVEQYLGGFYYEEFKCHRFVTLGKSKDGYYGLVFEKYDDTDEGLESIYDFSSVEPDDLNGKEVGPYENLETLIDSVNTIFLLDKDRYLMAGYLNNEIKN